MPQTAANQNAGFPLNYDTGQNLDTGVALSYRQELRARFVAGNTIQRQDFITLSNLLYTFYRHYHQYLDYNRIQDYGNNGSTASRNVNTDPIPGWTAPGIPDPASIVTATYINQHVTATNALRSHYHPIDDF